MMTARIHRYLPCVLVAGLLLIASCGDDDEVEATSGGAAELEGTAWVLTDDAIEADLGGIAVTARFDDGALTGTSGCNQYMTDYEVDGSSLTIGPDIAGTLRACPEPETVVEEEYLGLLPQVASYRIEGDTLTLADDEDNDVLEYDAVDGAEAIQGTWTVTGYYSADAVTSVLGGATLTAEFADGTVSGNSGCNSFNGPYTVEDDSIEIGPLASTLAACESEELQQQEVDFLAALELATTFQVAGGRLDLFRDGGAYAVTFESA